MGSDTFFYNLLDGTGIVKFCAKETSNILGITYAEITAKVHCASYQATGVYVRTIWESVVELLLHNLNLARHTILGDKVGVRHDGRGMSDMKLGQSGTMKFGVG